ncbi:MAG: thiolase family protein [Myxococcaceae bacterium]|nr:thiolase family protein [Myxococcaceae bacterium]
MSDVFVIGVATTPFRRWPEATHRQLAQQALDALERDAQVPASRADAVWFGNCALHVFGQATARGQVVLSGPLASGQLEPSTPIINVEAGCATGSFALHGAIQAIASGGASVALAIGVEKTFLPNLLEKTKELFDGAMDRLTPDAPMAFYAQAAAQHGLEFAPTPDRIALLDVCALQARWHMKTYGTTAEHLAASASKNHTHGALNPNAQHQKPRSIAEVLADKPVLSPLTRSMCAPISDGAAAVMVASADTVKGLPDAVRARAVKVVGLELATGRYRALGEPSVTSRCAQRLFARTHRRPDQVDVAEVHDATSFSEISTVEALGFCGPGEGGPWVASGRASLGGERPINLSGGLVSKGHPLAASGLAMVHELVTQLRQEAGNRQARSTRLALWQNAGGLTGFDEAACAVGLLERA